MNKRKKDDNVFIAANAMDIKKTLDSNEIGSAEYMKMIKQLCSEYVKLRNISTEKIFKESGSEALPCTEIFKTNEFYNKRRIKAAIEYLPQIAAQYRQKYQKLSVEQMTLTLMFEKSMYMPDSSPVRNISIDIITATALYILDDLFQNNNLYEAAMYIPVDEETIGNIEMSNDFEDYLFETNLIRGLVYLLLKRNNENSAIYTHNTVKRTRETVAQREYRHECISDMITKSETEEDCNNALTSLYETIQTMNPRERLDNILSLMSPETVKRAENQFKEDVFSYLDNAFDALNNIWLDFVNISHSFESELLNMDKLRKKLLKENTEYAQKMHNAKKQYVKKTLPVNVSAIDPLDTGATNPLNRIQTRTDFINAGLDASNEYIYAFEKLRKIHDTMSDMSANIRRANMIVINRHLPQIINDSDEKDASDTLKEMSNRWAHSLFDKTERFSVSNPFETCFAFFNLLDSGDNIVWLIEIVLAVISYAIDKLPWTNMFQRRNKQETNIENDNYDSYVYKYDECADQRKNTLMYSQKYNSYLYNKSNDFSTDTEDLLKRNLSQILFSMSGTLPPRNIFDYDLNSRDDLIKSGFNKKNADMMRIMFQYAKSATKVKFDYNRLYNDIKKQQITKSQTDDKIKMLKETHQKEIDTLEKEIRSLKQQLKAEKAKSDKLVEDTKTEKQELIALRDTIYRLQNDNTMEELEKKVEIDLPYTLKTNIVIFGGHDSWLRAFRPLIKNVRIIDPHTNPDINLIRNADTVWMQSNAMPHSYYNKIMDITRLRKIPVQYFAHASAEKCARQLAEYDMTQAEKLALR